MSGKSQTAFPIGTFSLTQTASTSVAGLTQRCWIHSVQNFEIVRGHLAALPVRDELEAHLLALVQITEAATLHSADMDKGIFAAVIRCNEAKTLFRVEPLYNSRRQWGSLSRT